MMVSTIGLKKYHPRAIISGNKAESLRIFMSIFMSEEHRLCLSMTSLWQCTLKLIKNQFKEQEFTVQHLHNPRTWHLMVRNQSVITGVTNEI